MTRMSGREFVAWTQLYRLEAAEEEARRAKSGG